MFSNRRNNLKRQIQVIRKRKTTPKLGRYRTKSSFFTKNPKTEFSNIGMGIFKAFILVIAIFLIYLFGFSNLFTIKEVLIENIDKKNLELAKEIENHLRLNMAKNIFFIDTEDLENKTKNDFSTINEIKIKKSLPNKLKAEYTEFPLTANILYQTSKIKKNYLINSLGFVVKENIIDENLPTIKIITEEQLNTNKPILNEEKLKYTITAINEFESKFGMKVVETEYKPIARELHLKTEKDFWIWLDMQTPHETQLKKLKKIIVKLDIYNEPLSYIDLRIAGNNGEKIIYKRR